MLRNKYLGLLFAITSGLCYSLLGYFGMHLLSDGYSISNATMWRFIVSSIFMFFLLIPTKFQHIRANLIESLKVFIYGALFYAPGAMAYFIASKSIGTGLSIVIFFTFPAMVMLINWYFIGTKITTIYYISVGMILLGLSMLIDLSNAAIHFGGILLSLASAFTYAIYIVVSKQSKVEAISATFLLSLGAVFTSFICTIFDHSLFIPEDRESILNIIGIGIICTALPILLLLQALKYISSEKVSLLSVLEPISIILVGVTMLGESITPIQTCGVMIILASTILTLSA